MTRKELGKRMLITAMLGAIGSLGLVTGCTIETQPERVVYTQAPPQPPPGQEIVVDQAPPPDQDVVVGVAPGPEYIWINGFYAWEGGRYAWRPGYYARRPWGGAVWVRPLWERGPEGRFHYHQGYWRR